MADSGEGGSVDECRGKIGAAEPETGAAERGGEKPADIGCGDHDGDAENGGERAFLAPASLRNNPDVDQRAGLWPDHVPVFPRYQPAIDLHPRVDRGVRDVRW